MSAAETIPELFDAAVDAVPDTPWLFAGDTQLTYAQARERIDRAAGALTDLGVGPGDLVLATTRNTPDYLLTWLATTFLGAILVPANPAKSAAELAGLARQVEPAVTISDPELRAGAGDALAGAIDVAALFERSGDGDRTVAGSAPRGEDPAVLIPTSGTTGRSKLVTQTHRAYAYAGEGFPWWAQLTAADRLMTSLPLFHINAPAYSVLGSVAARASLVLLPRFSASTFIDSARRYGATEFNAIGAMLEILMRRPERPDDADTPLRLCYTGPSPSRERQLEIERRFGLSIVCGYALSETTYGTFWRHGTRPYGTIGSVRQHPTLGTINEGRVLAGGAPVPAGGTGELELRNPAVMRGYWGMPEETERVLSPDGWLRTGDLVRVEGDSTYTFISRLKEVIRRRGENLAPSEVEAALESHASVTEAAVVGVPSELSEEDVKGFVVLADVHDDAPATELLAEIRAHAGERLAPFKIPRYLEAVAGLPHTATGRIAKHELPRERTDAELDLEPAARGAA